MNTLYTAGYTGTTPESILATAVNLNARIADIRIFPYSRVEHWIGRNLAAAWGQQYVHIRELGNRNYRNMHQGVMIFDLDTGCQQLAALLEGQPVIILCACENHVTCHRSTVAQAMIARYGVQVVHLKKADILASPKPVKQLKLF
jgi:uncharacterized protein (DUF488 family)